jgi:2-polyprenyl-6-hydroxyphenyl methylase/3-demethylubiquinone-9 3-methyltransferase
MTKLTTRPITSPDELVRHFDGIARCYEDAHGPAQRLLRYRLAVVDRLLGAAARGTLLEIGCGTGIHLVALAARFERALGTDVSTEMVSSARRAAQASPLEARIEVRVDPAEQLATVADGSVDVVLCVGALEHMLDKPRVLAQVRRVLKVGGSFACLTPNGGYCWYRALAPRLGLDTRHLSTDRFLTAGELRTLVRGAGLELGRLEHWRFVPRGDIPRLWGPALDGLDAVGRAARAGALRGGLVVLARRTV